MSMVKFCSANKTMFRFGKICVQLSKCLGSPFINTLKPKYLAMSASEDMQTSMRQVLQSVQESRNRSSLTVEKKVRQLCALYRELDQQEQRLFLQILAQELNVNHQNVRHYATSLISNTNPDDIMTILTEEKLRDALAPQYTWLFTQIGRISNGVKFLVDMRTHVLTSLDELDSDDVNIHYLRALNTSLKSLLSLWFGVGFLSLERVTWQSSCDMLQKISEYEAVHPMRNWTDLKRRVGPYRRCFVFTHSSMPREPIVVLHTALTEDISSTIQGIVVQRVHSDADISGSVMQEDSRKITTAIFYSITNTQRGLQGIELGNYLIKQVVRELQNEFPQMHQFSSLSPIPGFSKWLLNQTAKLEKGEVFTMFQPEELENIRSTLSKDATLSDAELWPALRKLFVTNSWIQNEKLTKQLQSPLMRLCTQYLYLEKHRGYALDSVANFHLRNGAVMWRLNWKADLSPKGLSNSCGIMVNYRYYLEKTEENSAKYLDERIIVSSEQILQLARSSQNLISETKLNNL